MCDTNLKGMRTVIQELEHVTDVLRVLDHEVKLHVELPADKLKVKVNWIKVFFSLRAHLH